MPRASETTIAEFKRLRLLGTPRAEAAKLVGMSAPWGAQIEKKLAAGADPKTVKYVDPPKSASNDSGLAGPIPREELCDEALRALDDFGYFRHRYFGRASAPWAEDAAAKLDALFATDAREYVVINVHPGVGKTTLLHDWCVHRTVKSRWIRGLWGSSTASLATRGTQRIRRTLEKTTTVKAKDRDREAGYAVDATGILAVDYGRFRPLSNFDVWRSDIFTVEQFDANTTDEKEATWAAFGRDTEELGYRADTIVWDDLVTFKMIRTSIDNIEGFQEWFDNEAETRLEPAGLFALMGQRLGATDLYRYCLNKATDEIDIDDEDSTVRTPMYHHIVYRAHDEDRCTGEHKDLEPWPKSCLLDPHRFPWAQARREMRDPQRWETVFQQGDAAGMDVLVQKLWLEGGHDPATGETHPGCWDAHRAVCEIPTEAGKPYEKLISYVTVDPSPTRWWSIQHWAYHPGSEQRFLIDLYRAKLQAPEFLDWVHATGTWTGVLEEWVVRAKKIGMPIKVVVVEQNAAQRFLLQYEHVKRWMRHHNVRIIGHNCVDTETELLSKRGWLKWDQVVVGDEILTLNTTSGLSEWKPVEYVYADLYDGPMYRFDSINIDALCTPDHLWPVTDQSMRPIKMVETQNLRSGNVVPLARPLAPDQDGDAIYSDDLIEMVGWAVTEGHFATPGFGVNIGQSNRANPDKVERIRMTLKRMGAQWSETRNRLTDVQVFKVSGHVARAIRAITDDRKHLPPEFIASLPAHQRELLLEVMVLGDGWRQGASTVNYCSDDEPLIAAIEMLGALRGSPTYRTTRSDKPGHKVVRVKDAAHAYLQNPSVRPNRVDNYKGIIWCPHTVNGTFYARRNGRTYFTGNTHENKTDSEFGVQTIGSLYRTGLVRLPGKSRPQVKALTQELTTYPHGATDDCVMSQWMGEFNLKFIKSASEPPQIIKRRRPSWLAA